MKEKLKRRLDDLESVTTDWAAKLDVIDYDWILADYDDGAWEKVHVDGSITVVKHRQTGEVRGIFADRRTDDEIRAAGGDLAYL